MKHKAIALAGLPNSGKTALVQELLKKLPGWGSHSTGGLIRKRYEVWKIQNSSTMSFEEYYKNIFSDDDILQINVDAKNLLKKGNIVLDSRFALLNRDDADSVLLVFLKAPLETRTGRSLPAYLDNSPEEVSNLLEERQEVEKRRGLELYGYDYTDEGLYSGGLILDSGSMTVDQEVQAILDALK
jgi:cytidylate kinase